MATFRDLLAPAKSEIAEIDTDTASSRIAAGALVLMGDPGRTYRPSDGLEQRAEYLVPTPRDLEDSDVRRTVVWRVLPFTGD